MRLATQLCRAPLAKFYQRFGITVGYVVVAKERDQVFVVGRDVIFEQDIAAARIELRLAAVTGKLGYLAAPSWAVLPISSSR